MSPPLRRATWIALAALLAACVDIPDVAQLPGDGGAPIEAGGLDAGPSVDGSLPADASPADAPSSADSAPVDSGCSPNLNTDANNCGRCGHACGAGIGCTNGVCDAFKIHGGGGEIDGLRLIAGYLYWTEGGSALYACAAPDCASPVTVVSGAAILGFGVASTTAYTVEGADVNARYVRAYSTTSPGSATGVTWTNGLYGLRAPVDVDAQEVWFFPWLNGGPQAFGSVHRSDTNVSSFAHVVTEDVNPAVVLRVATLSGSEYAFWTESSRLVRAPTVDSSSTTVMATGSGIAGLAVDASYVFWTAENDGVVYRCDALSDCTQKKTIAAQQLRPSRVAVDGQRIAWACRGTGSDGVISECAYPDCADGPFLIATGQTNPHDVVMDATYVYWGAGPVIYRVRR